MSIIRKESETDFDYKVRLCIAKLNKEIDLDWSEIAQLLHLDCSADHLRKLSYGYKEYYDYIQEHPEVKQNEDLLKEVQEKTLELKKEKVKFQDQRRELNKVVRDLARYEHLEDTIKEAVKELEKVKPLDYNQLPKYTEVTDNEMVVMLSDWHFGLECDNHWNTFDEDVFNIRIEKLIHKIIETAKLHRVSVLNMFALGDMVNGLIHTTSRIANAEDVIQQTTSVAETLCYMCNYLTPYFTKINFYNVNGNHDRVVANKSDNVDEESFAYIIDWYMRARLKQDNKIEIKRNIYDKGIVVTEICGHTFFGVHGDKDSPVKSIDNLTNILKIFPRFILSGHIHSNFEANRKGIDVIVNGSLSGVDSFAKDHRLYSQPMQKIMIINKKGRECTYNVEL